MVVFLGGRAESSPSTSEEEQQLRKERSLELVFFSGFEGPFISVVLGVFVSCAFSAFGPSCVRRDRRLLARLRSLLTLNTLTLDPLREGASCVASSVFCMVDCLSAFEDLRVGIGIERWCFLGAPLPPVASGGFEAGAAEEEASWEDAPAFASWISAASAAGWSRSDLGPAKSEPGELATDSFWISNTAMSMRRDLPVESACSGEDMGALPADSGEDEGEISRPVLCPLIEDFCVGSSSRANLCTCNDEDL
jgi:hypothetical protein